MLKVLKEEPQKWQEMHLCSLFRGCFKYKIQTECNVLLTSLKAFIILV